MPKLATAQFGAPCRSEATQSLSLTTVRCCICQTEDAKPIAVGEDFEYRTSPDTFLAVRCQSCGLVYLNPRPANHELSRIYPPDYHAFEFSSERYGFVYKVRRKLEASRLLSCCKGLGAQARIIDVGCGDGFHLGLLREFGQPGWQLEGVDPSDRAVAAGHRNGLNIHQGTVQDLDLAKGSYDLAFMIATIEHVDDPPGVLAAVRSLLKPGGKVVIVTDNTNTLDFQLFNARYWGGYHFPRHWNLFNPNNMRRLAEKTQMEVETLTTIVSPVNWVYSIRNLLVDRGAPGWIVERFSLSSTVSLGIFTLFDMLNHWAGKGALMRAILRRPLSDIS
jgi:SAM-dependent methyltransferase